MRFLVLSDIHGEVEKLDKLDCEFQKADGVLFLGDFARFKEPETGLPVFNALLKKHENIYAVLGNCDEPEFLEKLEKSNRIAVPGCHASGFIALVYPLIQNGILGKDTLLSAHSLTGYSGGGKKMIADYESDEKDALL